MITASVQYKLPPHIDLAACAAHFAARTLPRMIRVSPAPQQRQHGGKVVTAATITKEADERHNHH